MPKHLSLKNSSDFARVFKKGKRFLSERFVLYVCDNSLPESRFGVSIAKIHFKQATRRNRLRRVAKETFRVKVIPVLTKGYDCVLASRASRLPRDIKEACKEIRDLLTRIKA
ncbi:MAG: ribonuclease P protein component [Candidatus Omnitrophota bacterium]